MGLADPDSDRLVLADSAGLFASIACAIHCAAMPLVIGYLPLLGLEWLADESFHQVMAVVCFMLALSAFWPGWRAHGSLAPGVVGTAGVALLSVAAFGLEGSCCPTCAEKAETPAPTTVCTDETCPHCVAVAPEPAPTVEPHPIAAWTIPLITPLGGLLLVAGHLTNHRKLCGCRGGRCCHDESAPEDAPRDQDTDVSAAV